MNENLEKKHKDLPNKLFPFIWSYLKNKKVYLAGFTLVALFHALEISINPYLLKLIINTVSEYATDHTKMLAAMILPAAIYIAMPLLINLNLRLFQYINLRLYPDLKAAISKDIFSYLLHHSYAFFQNTFTGSLTKKIADLVDIEQLISMPVAFCFRLMTLLVASITLFISVQPLFGIILFVWAILFIYFSYVAAKGAENFSRKYAEASAKTSGTMSDAITNVMSIKLFATVPDEITYVDKDITEMVKNDRALQWYIVKVNLLQGIGVTFLTGFMLLGLIYGSLHGWISPGDFALVLVLSISVLEIVYNMGQEMQQFSKIMGTCNQALSFIREPHLIIDAPNAVPLIVKEGEIQFTNVSFQYETNNPVFFDLNLTIVPGEKVGLVGYSGVGKSTFIKLILRLIDPQSGHIMIDNQDIKKVTQNSLRKQISTIPQECDLFHRTIMENIRFAKMNASDDEVIEAAKNAKCHEFIMQLPNQYHSLVGERGVKLSSGQKQRIAIARAFLKNAPILLLDEATSSLDSITERFIQDSLHKVMEKKTVIVIAHRLSTLKDMDRILVFAQEKIAEDGSLESLLANKESLFYKLWHMQSKGFIPTIEE